MLVTPTSRAPPASTAGDATIIPVIINALYWSSNNAFLSLNSLEMGACAVAPSHLSADASLVSWRPPRREITFKTDPEKGDYELETGASRNFESWTDKQATEEEHKKAR